MGGLYKMQRSEQDGLLLKKIIYIIYLPLTISMEKSLYIQEIQSNGILVEYWDVSRLFFTLALSDSIDRAYIYKIKNYKDFLIHILNEDNKSVLFITQFALEPRTLHLYRILTVNNCLLAQFDRPGFPLYINKNNFSLGFILKKLLKFNKYPLYMINKFFSYLIRTNYIKNFDIIFAAGIKAIQRNQEFSFVLPVNHFDYDNALVSDLTTTTLLNKEYCVFIDDFLPFHPDFKILGVQCLEPFTYYDKMNRFFDRIEKELGVLVIISCHPKSDYINNPYNGRMLFKYKTLDLIKKSKFVIAHASTAISFAVIYTKPIIFVYTNEIKILYENTVMALMTMMSEFLQAKMMDTSDPLPMLHELVEKLNVIKYKEYKYQYLTTTSTEFTTTPLLIVDFLHKYRT